MRDTKEHAASEQHFEECQVNRRANPAKRGSQARHAKTTFSGIQLERSPTAAVCRDAVRRIVDIGTRRSGNLRRAIPPLGRLPACRRRHPRAGCSRGRTACKAMLRFVGQALGLVLATNSQFVNFQSPNSPATGDQSGELLFAERLANQRARFREFDRNRP